MPAINVDSNTRAVLYHVSNGHVNLGTDRPVTLAQQVSDFASNGRKDRENNTGYDNYIRAKKTIGTFDMVGFHYTESRTINNYNHINFNDENTQRILRSVGFTRGHEVSNSVTGHSKISAMKDITNATESRIKELAGLDKFNLRNAEKAYKSAVDSGNTAVATELREKIDFYRNNHLSDTKKTTEGHRAYGRDQARRYLSGDDQSRGYDFYRTSAKVTVAGAKIATKAAANTAINIGTSKVAQLGALGFTTTIDNLAGTNLVANSRYLNNTRTKADRVQLRKAAKDNVSEHLRHKTRHEKIAARRTRRQTKLLNKQRDFQREVISYSKQIKDLKKETLRTGVDNSKKIEKLTTKKNQAIDKTKRLQRRRSFGNNVRNSRVLRFGRRVTSVGSYIYQYNPVNLFTRLADKLKRAAFKIVGSLILAGALPILIVGLLASAGGILAHFVTEANPANKIADALAAPNYIQLIVNETTVDIATELQIALQNDAETHYLKKGTTVKSDGYDWTRSVEEAAVTKIYSTEKGAVNGYELPGVSANLQAIVQMAHKRFLGEIGFDNYFTVKAYVYMMYVYSHDALRDSNGDIVYSYSEIENCDKADASAIYANGDAAISVTYENADYNSDNWSITVTRDSDQEICNNIYIHGYDSTFNDSVNEARSSLNDFLTKTITKLGFAPSTSSLASQGIFVGEVPSDSSGECTHYAVYNILTHYENVESIEYVDTNGDGIGDTPKTVTTPTAVYEDVYVCLGHCGGHISPEVTLMEDMSYENLANHDIFVIPELLDATDFSNTLTETVTSNATVGTTSVISAKEYKTFEDWQKAWTRKIDNWGFTQYIKTPAQWFMIGSRNVLSLFAEAFSTNGTATKSQDVEAFEGWQVDDGSGGKKYTSSFYDLADIYGTYFDENMEPLDEPYAQANEIWDEIPVVFPTGTSFPLTKKQIQDILSQIKEAYPSTSETQLVVIEEALSEVGKWSYSLAGHSNGYYQTGGITDCSGFVGGVIYRTTGYNTTGMLAASYNGYSTRVPGSALSHANGGTGSSGISYTGHVVLYLGEIDGPTGYYLDGQEQTGHGYYVVECTTTDGTSGTILRRLDSLSKYTQTWNGYFQ